MSFTVNGITGNDEIERRDMDGGRTVSVRVAGADEPKLVPLKLEALAAQLCERPCQHSEHDDAPQFAVACARLGQGHYRLQNPKKMPR